MSRINTKNLSPSDLALFTASVVAVVTGLLGFALADSWYIPLIISAITFLVTYNLYYFTIQRFVYRKIKLIYKFIYQTKATKKEEFFYDNILPQKSIEQVSDDVQKWAAQRKNEIELLRANEHFRKEFLMNLAHELRTPIFTVQGYVDTLLSGALEDPNVNRKFLENANRSIDRLVHLVDDLSEISKLESGKIPIIQESFVIQDLIADVFEEFGFRAKQRQATMSVKKGTERSILVYADKMKVRQVLSNLIENALKYGHEGCMITAGCYMMDDRHAYIEISDDGPGIAEEHLGRIFERFYRADKSRSSKVAGTGLGLAIVKHIVEAHGQTVNVRSKVGVGSSFGFTLEVSKE